MASESIYEYMAPIHAPELEALREVYTAAEALDSLEDFGEPTDLCETCMQPEGYQAYQAARRRLYDALNAVRLLKPQ